MHDDSFGDEVRANPFDDGPRLVFADYLEEKGDPLCELIRVQIEQENQHGNSAELAELERRERQLIETHGESWLAPLRELGVENLSQRCFQRGLIEHARIPASLFFERASEICNVAPALHSIQLVDLEPSRNFFLAAELPKQIRSLDLSHAKLEGENWLHAACITQMESLTLQFNNLVDGLNLLLGRGLTALQRLDLSINNIQLETGLSVPPNAGAPNLQQLNLSVNRLGSAGVQALTQHEWQSLRTLDLSSNQIGIAGAEALSASNTFPQLRSLSLRGNGISDPRLCQLDTYKNLPHLEILDARNNRRLRSPG